MHVIISLVFAYLTTMGFAIIINIPRRALPACGLVGLCGWAVFMAIKGLELGGMLANLLSAFIIGLASMYLARKIKVPTILLNIPSLVPLVPGGQAYQAVRNFALHNNQVALTFMVEVVLIAGAIAMGLFLAEFTGETWLKFSLKMPS